MGGAKRSAPPENWVNSYPSDAQAWDWREAPGAEGEHKCRWRGLSRPSPGRANLFLDALFPECARRRNSRGPTPPFCLNQTGALPVRRLAQCVAATGARRSSRLPPKAGEGGRPAPGLKFLQATPKFLQTTPEVSSHNPRSFFDTGRLQMPAGKSGLDWFTLRCGDGSRPAARPPARKARMSRRARPKVGGMFKPAVAPTAAG